MRMLLFSFFLSLSAQAAIQPNGVPMVILGSTADVPAGQAALSLSQLSGSGSVFSLFAVAPSGGTSNYHSPFRISGVPYKVPAGKNAHCFAVASTSAASGVAWQLMYATAIFGVEASAPTGAVYQYGASGSVFNYTSSTTYRHNAHPWTYIFPPGAWPGIQYGATNSSTVFMQCTEVVVQ